MPISKVFMICNAYESGVGHGFERDFLPNPHVLFSDEFEAYDLGYEEGISQREELDQAKEKTRVQKMKEIKMNMSEKAWKEIKMNMSEKAWKELARKLADSLEIYCELTTFAINIQLPEDEGRGLIENINLLIRDTGTRHRAFNNIQMRKHNYRRIN